MKIVHPVEFVEAMAPALSRAAQLASGTSQFTLLHKKHEQIAGSESEVDRASRVDVLSEMDLAIQELLLRSVFERWPFVEVLAEEDTPARAWFTGESEYCVLIDPVDGTKNFLRGDPHFCHILSLCRGHEMLATLLYSHFSKLLFVALRGEGASIASVQGHRLPVRIPRLPAKTFFHHVSRIPEAALRDLTEAGFQTAVSTQNASDLLTFLDGNASGFISYTPLVYDVWSPGMIVQEAGGWISDWRGDPLVFQRQARLPHVLVAASPEIAFRAIERLRKYV